MDSKVNKSEFKLISKMAFSSITENTVLPESDLCMQDGKHIYQFKFNQEENADKKVICPGVFAMSMGSTLELKKIELKKRTLLESLSNTSAILNEAKTFFSRLHVYEKLGRLKKRGLLLYSPPGYGKTAAIEKACEQLIEEDAGTVILIWPTSQVPAEEVAELFTQDAIYDPKCTRLVMILEDIGGKETPGEYGHQPVTAALLNILDGVGVAFTLPTFIVATTNHPESLLSSLANRPGRFDLMLELKAPSADERVAMLKFAAKRELEVEEENAIKSNQADGFSLAHLEEVVVRSLLHDKTIPAVIKELFEHAKKFSKGFDKDRSVGF